MARFKCRNCKGDYSDIDQAVVLYFHACPRGRVLSGDHFTLYQEQDRRDENIIGPRRIRQEGKGREQIA